MQKTNNQQYSIGGGVIYILAGKNFISRKSLQRFKEANVLLKLTKPTGKHLMFLQPPLIMELMVS